MASTADGARLTELHRQAQSRIASDTAGLMSTTWALVDPYDLDGSFPQWERTSAAVIRHQAQRSAELAAGYYSGFRELEVGEALVVPAVVELTDNQIAASLRYTGPGAVKRAQRSRTIDEAMSTGQAMSARSASRMAMSGGRSTVTAAVESDPDCIGYARVTGGRPCSFCAMLASRGAVYKASSSGSGGFPAHDGCHCGIEPIYGSNPVLPPGSEYYRDLWDESTAGLGGADAREAFRKALDEHPLPPPKPVKQPRRPKFSDEDYEQAAQRHGVSADEVRTSRRQVAEMRRRVYDEAASTAEAAMDILERADALAIRAPGRNYRGGEFDWMEALDPRERARLQRNWFSSNSTTSTIDEVAQRLRETMPGLDNLTDDEVIRRAWLPRTRQVDASGALRRGKLPSSRQYSGSVDPSDFAPNLEADGFDVVRLFADDLDAAAHIAQVNGSAWVDDAFRALDSVSTRGQLGPPPWEMSFQSWEAEVRMLEGGLRNGDEIVMSVRDARARLDELVPYLVDEPGMSYEDVYGAIVTTARTAQLDVPAHAVIDWAV